MFGVIDAFLDQFFAYGLFVGRGHRRGLFALRFGYGIPTAILRQLFGRRALQFQRGVAGQFKPGLGDVRLIDLVGATPIDDGDFARPLLHHFRCDRSQSVPFLAQSAFVGLVWFYVHKSGFSLAIRRGYTPD